MRSKWNIAVLIFAFILVICFVFICKDDDRLIFKENINDSVNQALYRINLSPDALSLPKLNKPISLPGRIPLVDRMLNSPLSMVNISYHAYEASIANSNGKILSNLLSVFIPDFSSHVGMPDNLKYTDNQGEWLHNLIGEVDSHAGKSGLEKQAIIIVLRALLEDIAIAKRDYLLYGGKPTDEELKAIRKHLHQSFAYKGEHPNAHWQMPDAYHSIGGRMNISILAASLARFVNAVEKVIPVLQEIESEKLLIEIDTKYGRILVSGSGNDMHSGSYLILIDVGGDDVYENVGPEIAPGEVSIVIDLAGDDVVHWSDTSGPGAGILGMGFWADLSGDDTYEGHNIALGAAVLGGGFFLDAGGDDSYTGGALVQGAGQYGIGVSIDRLGNDFYMADLKGQGFGGPGGLGVHLDLEGDDRYRCGGRVPDQAEARKERHDSTHYLSMCQGFAYGLRPEVSAGVGVLIDREGDDYYEADIFAQGGAYWFGLGMMMDFSGDDKYMAFEHAQGGSLHLGAGYLGDWGGDDKYECYEHCQGVGLDRAIGLLHDQKGDDVYRSVRESQGTGLKPYGMGLLIDQSGDDQYFASIKSQGYSANPSGEFHESQWPIGILLDMEGKDSFRMPGRVAPSVDGRIQNQQGIAIDQ